MRRRVDTLEDTVRMWDDDTISVLEVGDTELQLILGDENAVIELDEPQSDGTPVAPLHAVWDSRELARVACRLARYRP